MATSTTSSVPVGSTGAGGGNTLRITGLNTGLDIDAMVEKMLTADQTKVDKAKQQQQLITWKQEAYKDIITSLKDLQSAYFDVANASSNLMSSSNYNNMTAKSLDSTIVSAKASTTAASGTYKILVAQLAQPASIVGSKIDAASSLGSSTPLIDLDSELEGNSVSIKLSGISDPITLNVTSSSTIQDLANAINNQTGGAVTAKFDELIGKFSIQDSNTGSTSSLSIESGTDDLLEAIGMKDSSGNTLYTSNAGQNAFVAIKEPNSSSYIVSEQSSNNFTINGMTYSISDINCTSSTIDTILSSGAGTDVTATSTDSPTSISVAKDTSTVHDLIKNFIDKYNEIVGTLQDKLSEKKDYDYSPLTDSQKSSMSDTDISNWEKKAKQGILRNDSNLQNLLDQLANAFTTPVVDSSGKNVSTLYFGNRGTNAIGIDTSSTVSEGAKISIVDDEKLTDAIANHPDELIKLFTTTSDSKDSTKKFQQSGIFERIDQILDENVGVIGSTLNEAILTKYANVQDDYSTTGSSGTGTLPDQLYQQQLLITKLTEIMNDHQTKYYNQFTQLEVAMEKLNAQQSTLSLYLS